MDTEITEGKEGEVTYDIELKDKKLVLSGVLDSKGADVELKVHLEVEYFLDKLAAAIPGKYDDMLFEMLKKALL